MIKNWIEYTRCQNFFLDSFSIQSTETATDWKRFNLESSSSSSSFKLSSILRLLSFGFFELWADSVFCINSSITHLLFPNNFTPPQSADDNESFLGTLNSLSVYFIFLKFK